MSLFTKGHTLKNFHYMKNGLTGIRRLTSRPTDPPIDLLYTNQNELETIAKLMETEIKACPDLQLEAAWIITNLAGSQPEDTAYCANQLKAIQRFINVLKTPVPLCKNNLPFFETLRDQVIYGYIPENIS
jgi:hypothetical protein